MTTFAFFERRNFIVSECAFILGDSTIFPFEIPEFKSTRKRIFFPCRFFKLETDYENKKPDFTISSPLEKKATEPFRFKMSTLQTEDLEASPRAVGEWCDNLRYGQRNLFEYSGRFMSSSDSKDYKQLGRAFNFLWWFISDPSIVVG